MAPSFLLPLYLLLLPICSCSSSRHLQHPLRFWNDTPLDRNSFPPDFVFGALTMAVKHEGAAFTDGKSHSLWDAYASLNGTVIDGSTPGEVGDQYHRYKDDIKLLSDMGMDAFRFSIAWTRILPNGTSGEVNEAAVAHYNDLIDQLLEAGIEPHATLWCQDHPQALEEAYLGLLSPRFINDFLMYASVCFKAFGDRVKYWITFDEPNDFTGLGYASSQAAPGRCTSGTLIALSDCHEGNSSTEPYIVAHHFLLAHSAAVKLYRDEFQAEQGGQIGIALWFRWYEPLSNASINLAAAKRAQDFFFGWFMDPLVYGQYPSSMRTLVGPRLPKFTEEQSFNLRGAFDFIAINAVTATYATWNETEADFNSSGFDTNRTGYFHDMMVINTAFKDGEPIGKWVNEYEVPWCMKSIANYMKITYNNPTMFISELGMGINDDYPSDDERIQFFGSYYSFLSAAIREGANVKGVFAWSLIDGFEFYIGKDLGFGLYYVDDNFNRFPKLSALWHKDILSIEPREHLR